MYEKFYGLTRKPFSLTPDPQFLYLSKQHAVTLAMLEYGLGNQAGFTLITGEIGSGKTTLIRHILKNMGREITVGVITNTHRNFGDLLTWILSAYGLERSPGDKVMMYQQLVDFVASEFFQERRVVLIVDEAQNMDVETLEELRLLSNMNIGDELLLQLIIVGQPELQQTLLRPELTQFAQRISVEHHITALDLADTGKYIDHRIRVAGGRAGLFDRYAVAVVYYFSRGTPRSINNLCDMALVYGFAEEQNPISCEIVVEVVKTRRIIREQAARAPRDPGDERLRQMVLEIKGIDLASLG
jgi:type II secretory pathway predicted ATPase ExeA